MAVNGFMNIITSGLTYCIDPFNLKSYPGSGTIAIDLTKTRANTNLTNGAAWTSTGGFRFDGADDYLNNPALALGTSYTISMWVYPDVVENSVWTSQENLNYMINFFNGNIYNRLNNSLSILTPVTPIQANVWQHIIMVRNGTTHHAFVNGVKTDTVTNGSWTTTYTLNAIGTYIGSPGFSINGGIGSVYVFNRILNDDEALILYNNTKWKYM